MASPRRQPPDLRATDNGLARFGWLLGFISLSVVFSMGAPDATWGELVALVLQAGVLLLAVHAVEAPRRLQRLAVGAAAAVVVLGGGGLLLDTGESRRLGAALVAGLGVVLVAATIAAIVGHLRSAGALTGRTVLGALCGVLGAVFVAAAVFALGVTFFWPTTLAFVSENLPQSGAFGLSIMGGLGMLSVSGEPWPWRRP